MGVLEKLRMAKSPWSFQAENLTEYTGHIKNPARGWYQIHTFLIENEPDLDELEWCIDKHDSLATLVIDIGSSRNQNLGSKELARIGKILSFFRDYQFDIILRVVYDHEGQAIEREPDFFSQIQQHVAQIWGVISDFDDALFVYQGMMIGNWGEMHTSKFLAPEKLERLAETFRDNKSYKSFLAVRRPKFWRLLHEPGTDPAEKPTDLMGLFDDAILGSATDLGTYGDKDAAAAGWVNSWCREDELEFEDQLCKNVPNGGEVVYGDGFSDRMEPEEILAVLLKKHISYLNRLHDAQVLEKWKGMKPFQTGVWREKSFYEYVGEHLGYRFVIQRINIKPDKSNPRDFAAVEIVVENCGFANLYEEAELILLCEKTSREESEGGQGMSKSEFQCGEILLPVDMRKWNPQKQYAILWHLKVFEGRLYLAARRKKDGAVLRFANNSDQKDKIFLGEFGLK